MKNSPFAFFRKHQRIGMVTLTVMAMFAFVFMDFYRGGPGGGSTRAGEIAAYVKNSNLTHAQIQELKVQRDVVNDFIARIIVAVSTTEEDNKRNPQQINQMIQMNQFGIEWPGAPGSDINLVWGHVMRLEARRLGLVVTDPMITSYILRIHENRLTDSQFTDVLKSLGLRQRELYDLFAEELLARNAWLITRPVINHTPEQYWHYYRQLKVRQNLEVAALPVSEFTKSIQDPPDSTLTAFFESHKDRFPEQGPDFSVPGFRQPSKARVQYLTASYEDIENSVPEVTDQEVIDYYEKNKDTLYRDFTQPEDTKPETDAPMTEGTPTGETPAGDTPAESTPAEGATPEGTTPTEEAPKPESQPDAAQPEATEPAAEKPATDTPATDTPATDTPATEKPAGETPAEPAPEATPSTEATEETPAEPSSEEKGPSCQEEPAAPATEEPAAQEPAADTPAAETPATETPAADAPAAAQPAAETPAAPATTPEAKPATEAPAADTPATEAPAAEAPAEETKPEFPPEVVRYQPLDDNRKDNIRQQLLKAKTDEAINKKLEDAAKLLEGRNLKYNLPVSVSGKIAYIDFNEDGEPNRDEDLKVDEPVVESQVELAEDDIEKLPAEIVAELRKKVIEIAAADMQQVGQKLGFKYNSTELLTEQEIDETPGLGRVESVTGDRFAGGNELPILAVIFGREQLFDVATGRDTDEQNPYVYWKVDFEKTHIPTFTEPGIREQVLTAWKLQQAYPEALKRAEELAKLVGEQKLDVALKGQTVNNAKDGLPIVTHETADFTWMTPGTPSPTGWETNPPVLSTVNFVEKPGREFMQAACEDLAIGETGVAPNRDKSIIYILRVINREPKPGEETERMRETFMKERLFGIIPGILPSAYSHIAQDDENWLRLEWMEELKRRYQIKLQNEELLF